MNFREGDRVRVEFTGTVTSLTQIGAPMVNIDGTRAMTLPVPPKHVTKIHPALRKGQVWEAETGVKFFVSLNAGNYRIVDEDGDRYDIDDVNWEELSLRSDA